MKKLVNATYANSSTSFHKCNEDIMLLHLYQQMRCDKSIDMGKKASWQMRSFQALNLFFFFFYLENWEIDDWKTFGHDVEKLSPVEFD